MLTSRAFLRAYPILGTPSSHIRGTPCSPQRSMLNQSCGISAYPIIGNTSSPHHAHISDPCLPYHFHSVFTQLRYSMLSPLYLIGAYHKSGARCSPFAWVHCAHVKFFFLYPIVPLTLCSAPSGYKNMAWPARRSPPRTPVAPTCPRPYRDTKMLLHVPHHRVPEPYQPSLSPKPSCKYANQQITDPFHLPLTSNTRMMKKMSHPAPQGCSSTLPAHIRSESFSVAHRLLLLSSFL